MEGGTMYKGYPAGGGAAGMCHCIRVRALGCMICCKTSMHHVVCVSPKYLYKW
jgi:hypothetical protein